MKKLLFIMLTALLAVSCEKSVIEEETFNSINQVTFTVLGSGNMKLSTRGYSYLPANELQLIDVYMFDYVDGQLVQTIHQIDSIDKDFGKVTMFMKNGHHELYFLASKGLNPTLFETRGFIAFSQVSDTFWKRLDIDITPTSDKNVSVALDRIVTKLNIGFNEAVPSNASYIDLNIDKWYLGVYYKSGEGATYGNLKRTFIIQEQDKGTTNLQIEFWGFIPSFNEDFTTNIEVTGYDKTNHTIGYATIQNAPFKPNRETRYKGDFFTGDNGVGLILNTTWNNTYTNIW